jgi:protein gp37
LAQKSDIEWTDATWNPVTGCTKVGPGCDNCYAERFAERWRGIAGHPYEQGFDLTLWPSRLKQPVLWKKPRMIFVNSMSDLFHKDIERKFIDAVFDAMEQADWHVYARNARAYGADQVAKIAAGMAVFGWTVPCLPLKSNRVRTVLVCS